MITERAAHLRRAVGRLRDSRLGRVAGVITGSKPLKNVLQVTLKLGQAGANYNFGELPSKLLFV